jgi:hypothetical protein
LSAGVFGVRRPAGGDPGDDVQRERAGDGPLEFQLLHVRRVELAGRLLLDGVHPASVLHLGGPLLRHRQALQVPHQHDQARRRRHAAQRLGLASHHLLRPHLHGLVSFSPIIWQKSKNSYFTFFKKKSSEIKLPTADVMKFKI